MLSQGKKGAPTRLLCPEEALCVCLRVRACRVHACLWGRVSVSVLARLHMAVCTRVCPWACSGAALLRAHARLGTGCGSGWLFVSPPFSPRPAALETPPLTPPPRPRPPPPLIKDPGWAQVRGWFCLSKSQRGFLPSFCKSHTKREALKSTTQAADCVPSGGEHTRECPAMPAVPTPCAAARRPRE